MKPFRSTIIVKHARPLVWGTIRDHLPELAPYMDDVARIEVLERRENGDGQIDVVNYWHAKLNVPAPLARALKTDKIGWTDRAQWHEAQFSCRWQIEPSFFPDRTRCSGTTTYEDAMGGRGTRITFSGELDVDARNIPGLPATLEPAATKLVESIVTTLIPRNFRKISTAIASYLSDVN